MVKWNRKTLPEQTVKSSMSATPTTKWQCGSSLSWWQMWVTNPLHLISMRSEENIAWHLDIWSSSQQCWMCISSLYCFFVGLLQGQWQPQTRGGHRGYLLGGVLRCGIRRQWQAYSRHDHCQEPTRWASCSIADFATAFMHSVIIVKYISG